MNPVPESSVASSSKLLLWAVGAGGLAIGALFVFLGWRLWQSSRELAKSGVSSQATVVRKYRQTEGAAWGGLENYFIEVDYATRAGRKNAALRVPSSAWRQLKEGRHFAVSYFPQKPEEVKPWSVRAHKFRCAVGMTMMVIGGASAVLFPCGALWELLTS